MNFKVGDVCEIHSLDGWRAAYNGTECCIAGGVADRYGDMSKKIKMCYRIHCALDNQFWLIEPQYLRLKQLPEPQRQELGEWELCPWRPPVRTKERA